MTLAGITDNSVPRHSITGQGHVTANSGTGVLVRWLGDVLMQGKTCLACEKLVTRRATLPPRWEVLLKRHALREAQRVSELRRKEMWYVLRCVFFLKAICRSKM
jgi:hypothetical protein